MSLLGDFFNSTSDAAGSLEASQQEKLESDFSQWLTEDKIIDSVDSMCLESLDPEEFEKWESVKAALFNTRKNLK